MKNEKIVILMIAPSEGKQGGGGVATYAKILTERLGSNFNVIRIVTLKENNIFNKIMILIFAIIKTLYVLMKKNKKIAHIHAGEKNSFIRKSIFVKLCKYFNIPIVFHLHATLLESTFNQLSEKEQERIRNTFKLCDKVVLLSESSKNWYIESIETRIPCVIYNGMDDLKTSFDIVSKRKNNILFLGRLGDRKGIYDLIKAFKIVLKTHNDAQLILCGDGEINKSKELVNSLEINDSVKFFGWVDFEEKRDLLNSSKIFALPSYYEAFPLSILEAMSVSLSIVSTKTGGIPEEIEDGKSGFLIDSGDVQALYLAINKILDNDFLCDDIGNNARERYLKYFTISKIIKDVERIYRKI